MCPAYSLQDLTVLVVINLSRQGSGGLLSVPGLLLPLGCWLRLTLRVVTGLILEGVLQQLRVGPDLTRDRWTEETNEDDTTNDDDLVEEYERIFGRQVGTAEDRGLGQSAGDQGDRKGKGQ